MNVQIDLSTLSAGRVYHLMTQTVVPRPIAWVLTRDLDGVTNLAPFSYFTAVSSAPPVLMVSVGPRPDGTPKDTARIAEATGRFVVHVAPAGMIDAVNDSAAPYAPGTSEVDAIGLALASVEGWPLPRVVGPRVAFSCSLHRVGRVGVQRLLFGEIERAWLDDAVVTADAKGRFAVAADAVDPLTRLGASQYASLGPIRERRRKTTVP